MRTSSPRAIDALLPKVRQRILGALLLQPDRAWYQLDLANQLGVRSSSLQRELARLAQAGILTRRREGRRSYYQANVASPMVPHLQGLLRRSSGLADVLREELEPLRSKIRAAFVFGSVARGAERADSNVDLMVVGSATLRNLLPALKKAETTLGRPVNAKTLTHDELRAKAKQVFVRNVAERSCS